MIPAKKGTHVKTPKKRLNSNRFFTTLRSQKPTLFVKRDIDHKTGQERERNGEEEYAREETEKMNLI